MPHNVHGVLQVYFAKLNPWLKEKISSMPENFQPKPLQPYAAKEITIVSVAFDLTVKSNGKINSNISALNFKYRPNGIVLGFCCGNFCSPAFTFIWIG